MVVTLDLRLFIFCWTLVFPEKRILNEFKAVKGGSSVLFGSIQLPKAVHSKIIAGLH